jgi:hypothetical protein
MRKVVLPIVVLAIVVLVGRFAVAAQDASPVPVQEPAILVLVERALAVANIDNGESGPSAGDMIVWGPNALFDESNTNDSGAVTQGACIYLDDTSRCILTETVVFPNGSTIEIQGIQAAGAEMSTRTIVGGSGQFRGASGTVLVEPTDDLEIWVKTFDIWF